MKPFVITPFHNTELIIERLLKDSNSILLEGEPGCGKSSLLKYIAEQQHMKMLSVHFGDDVDAKALIGSYITSDSFSEFKWKDGSLTTAVKEGYWFLLEDVDTAPPDVISLILPLLKTRTFFIPNRSESVTVHPNFRLIGTRTLHKGGMKINTFHSILSSHFTIVSMPEMKKEELTQLLLCLYQRIQIIIPTMLQCHETIKLKGITGTLRQLLSFCKRVEQKIPLEVKLNQVTTQLKHILLFECDSVYLSNELQRRIEILQVVAQTIQIPSIDFMLNGYKPIIEINNKEITIGHIKLNRNPPPIPPPPENPFPFSKTQHSLVLMEKIADCIINDEPILLVGETGTGKTTMIQQLASLLNQKLIVYNLNQQTESSDLVGGFKPVQLKLLCHPLRIEFIEEFNNVFARNSNEKFINQLNSAYEKQDFNRFLTLIIKACDMVDKKIKTMETSIREHWNNISNKARKYKEQINNKQSGFAFSFIEGDLVKALRNGYWILFDEINLASHDTLERISGLLDGESILLTEIGDVTPIPRHKNFRLFANMNPPTDVGKKDLAPVRDYLNRIGVQPPAEKIVQFHLKAKQLAHDELFDGAGQRPLFSLRTLCLALQYITDVTPFFGFERALYEGMSMSYLTQLNRISYPIMEKLINETFNKTNNSGSLPKNKEYINYGGYFIEKGDEEIKVDEKYILTETTKKRLESISRIVMSKRYPILLQGPTSAGKTSLVEYLAKATGHRMVRVNNHEQTDVQEYLGSYVPTEDGKLIFQEGILVEAVRKGYWIVLDELNLAPSEVLEALNRLLDFNRELYIPETQETVKPHPQFMLFATQNPPNTYGGRKHLSRAFRNRFIELHFDEIPENELEIILEKRSLIPPSYCKKLVNVLKDLEKQRSMTQFFGGKHSFITLRELFKWADRHANSYEELARDGYFILAEKMRNVNEKQIIQEVLERNLKVKLDFNTIYNCKEFTIAQEICKEIVWTPSMRRLFCLIIECMKHKEPALLIGETGCGKTTVCQIVAHIMNQKLKILNCHQHTETADFIGGMRPVRNKEQTTTKLHNSLKKLFNEDETLNVLLNKYTLNKIKNEEIDKLISEYRTLFKWYDGPLIEAMKNGDMFLIDEINMAEDSVLERLNSVLEPSRMMTIAEKTSNDIEEVIANETFRIFGTMNPGGDFGKRELSPAMRNRFTEIYVKAFEAEGDLLLIVEQKIKKQEERKYAKGIVNFLVWSEQRYGKKVSVRNCLAWTDFMNNCEKIQSSQLKFIHGAHLVVIDSLKNEIPNVIQDCMTALNNALILCGESLNEESMKAITEIPKMIINNNSICVSDFNLESPTNSLVLQQNYCIDAPTTTSNVLHLFRAMTLHKAILMEGSPGVGKTTIIEMLASMLNIHLYRINLSEHTDISDLLGTDLPLEGNSGGFGWCDGLLLRAMKSGSWVLLDELNLASQSVLEGLNSLLDHRATVFIPELNIEVKCPPTFRLFASQNPLGEGSGRKGLPQSFLNRFTEVYVNKMTTNDMEYIIRTIYPVIPQQIVNALIQFIEKLEENICQKKLFGRKGSPWEFNLRDILRFCKLYIEYSSNIENEIHNGKLNTLTFIYNTIFGHRFREIKDQQYAFEIWRSCIGTLNTFIQEESNDYSITQESFRIGEVEMERRYCIEKKAEMNYLLPKQLSVMKGIMKGINNRWLISLIGDSHCGKTSIVRNIAQLTGHIMKEFSMNTSVDTIDLIGGYEQMDFERHRRSFLQDIKDVMMVCNNEKAKEIYQMLLCCVKAKDLENTRRNCIFEDVEMKIIKELNQCINDDFLKEGISHIEILQKKKAIGSFEWVDGIVVKCMQRGYWLMMENVNFCNPTVLDRLNSLFEPNGYLVLNERGVSSDGTPIVIKPHKDFRVIFTSNPINGEISRAMRNRALELFVPSLDDIDIERILVGFNLSIETVRFMLDIHKQCENVSLLHLIRWGKYVGNYGVEALKEGFNTFYVTITSDEKEQERKQSIYEQQQKQKINDEDIVTYDILANTQIKQMNEFIENISIGVLLSKMSVIIPYIYTQFKCDGMSTETNGLNDVLIEALKCYQIEDKMEGNEVISTVMQMIDEKESTQFITILQHLVPNEKLSVLLQIKSILLTVPSKWIKAMLMFVLLIKSLEEKEKQNENNNTIISRSSRKVANVYSKYLVLEQSYCEFLNSVDKTIDSIHELSEQQAFSLLVLRVLFSTIGFCTEINIQKYIILCVLLRSIHPVYIEMTNALFKQYCVDETLIGRLWSHFSQEFYPKHTKEFTELIPSIQKTYDDDSVKTLALLFDSCFRDVVTTIQLPEQQKETYLTPLYNFLKNISVINDVVNNNESTYNPFVYAYQNKQKNDSIYTIPLLSESLGALWKTLPSLPFLPKSNQLKGVSLLYQSVIPRARAYFISNGILDVFSIPTQISLLKDIKNISINSNGDVNSIINKFIVMIQTSLIDIFNTIVNSQQPLEQSIQMISPKLTEYYNNSIRLIQENNEKQEGINLYRYGCFIYNCFMMPCIDPMEYPKYFIEVANSRITIVSTQMETLIKTRALIFGVGFEMFEKFLKTVKDNIENEKEQYNNNVKERNSDIPYEQLYQEFRLFTTSNGNYNKINELFNSIENINDIPSLIGIISHETMWQEQTEFFIEHIQNEYPLFRDITIPILFGLYLLKTGIRIELFKKILKHLRNDNAEKILKSVIAFPVNSDDINEEVSCIGDFILQHIEQNNNSFNNTILKILFVNMEKGYKGDVNGAVKTIVPLLRLMVALKNAEEEEKRRIEEEEAQQFKYKTKTNELAIDEDKEEEEYREEFPDFFADIQDLLQQQSLDIPNTTPIISDKPKKKKARSWITDEDVQFILGFIENVLNEKESNQLFDETMEERNEVFKNMLAEYFDNKDIPLPKEFDWISSPFHTVFIHTKTDLLIHPKEEKLIDLNKDGCVHEIIELMNVLDQLYNHVCKLLEEFPENEMLVKINSIVDRIRGYPKTAPLMKYLVTLHVLFGELQNWQNVAAQYVSLQEEMNRVALVIQKWRSWQLKSWNKLSDNIIEKHKCNARGWFVNVWKMVQEYIASEGNEQYELQFLESMNQFVYKCNYGQFNERIHLLEILIKLTQKIFEINGNNQWNKVNVMFIQIKEYYSLFKTRINEQIEQSIKPIIEKIKDFIKLTKWNDINYAKLQDQTEKSNRKLFAFTKEFDNLLKESIQPIVQSETFESNPSEIEKVQAPEFVPLGILEKINKGNGDRVQEIKYYINKIKTLHSKTLRKCVEDITFKDRDGLKWLELFEDELIGRVKELQETKGKEGVVLKKRALLDVIEMLEGYHLSHSRKTVNLDDISLEMVLRKPCKIEGNIPLIQKINEYHFKTISKFQLFNKVKINASNDLNGKEIEYTQNYVNNLYDMCMKQSSEIRKMQNFVNYLKKVLSILSHDEEKFSKVSHLTLLRNYVFLSRIENVLEDSILVEESLREKFNGMKEKIQKNREVFKNIMEETVLEGNHFMTTKMIENIKSMTNDGKNMISVIEQEIKNIGFNNSQNVLLILKSLKEIDTTIEEEFSSSNKINEMLEECLITCQILFKASSQLNEEENDSFPSIHSFILAGNGVHNNLKEMTENCLTTNTKYMKELLTNVEHVLEDHYITSLHIHKSVRKFTVMCLNTFGTLYKDGFCNQEEKEDDGKQEKGEEFITDGVGMAEGKGINDVSKEIKDQEQLTGLKGEKQQEQNKDEKQDMDKGFDMQDDFDGEEYDEEPNEDGNNKDQEEEDVDRDQIMGDVDKDKREIVDAEMWDKEDNDKSMEEENAIGKGMKGEAEGMGSEEEGNVKEEKEKKKEEHQEQAMEEGNDEKEEKGEEQQEEGQDVEETEKLQTLPGKEQIEEENQEEGGEDDEFKMNEEGEENMSIEEENNNENEEEEQGDQFDIDALNKSDEEAKSVEEEKADGENEDMVETKELEQDLAGDMNQNQDNGKGDMNEERKNNEEVEAEHTPMDAYGVEENTGMKSNAKIDSTQQKEGEGSGNNEENNTKVGDGEGHVNGNSKKEQQELRKVQQEKKGNGDTQNHIEDLTMTEEQKVVDGQKSGDDKDEYVVDETAQQQTIAPAKEEMNIEKMEEEKTGEGEKKNMIEKKERKEEDMKENQQVDGIMEEDTNDVVEKEKVNEQYIRERVIEESTEKNNIFNVAFKENTNDKEMVIEEVEKKQLIDEINEEKIIEIGESEKQQWSMYESKTNQSAMELCEKLRIVLEPSLASQMKGDYRTGKKINMKKVIPYIASGFKKDKIWLRRTRAQKRDYQILVAIDDSQSMIINNAGEMALETVALLSSALTKLEVGELSVVRFGEDVKCVQKFGTTFNEEDGARIVKEFQFNQNNTDMVKLMKSLYVYLHESGLVCQRYNPSIELDVKQIIFILSDGRFSDKKGISKILRDFSSMKTFVVFIVLDNPSNESILEMKSVNFENGQVNVEHYMDTFPFPHYIILHDLNTLPNVLAEALRQWFEMTTQN
ncbi:midasin, putative [Entamoeba histolytica HM-3:IMSS]|uniref:Midasin n=1 Tax=Entamoeba histolytica HM-3:IMSS TaxID=885315 RepID=M7WYC2_ENTHI|nr:midasin, putative [Entamoeba histolytica HM-3:IMSS]